MAWDDKFNNWYNRAIPDSSPGITWQEPAAGARDRWKANLPRTGLIAAGLFPVMAWGIHIGKRVPGPAWPASLEIAAAFVALVFLFGWIGSFFATAVSLSPGGRRKTSRGMFGAKAAMQGPAPRG